MNDDIGAAPTETTNADTRAGLTYEETPIIDPNTIESSGPFPEHVSVETPGEKINEASVVPEAARIFQSSEDASLPSSSDTGRPPKKNFHIGTIIFIVLLFGLGVWLSTQLRSFISEDSSTQIPVPTISDRQDLSEVVNPSPATSSAKSDPSWVTHAILSGAAKSPVSNLAYKLPSDVVAPVCDAASCASQGTNLSGGTRFTVAARGKGQALPDFRGAILTDTTGNEFTMKQTMLNGVYAYEYTGDFTGRTGGGYTFTKMRGVLVPISDSLSVEFNHFSPAGTTTDFAKDDTVFDAIVASLTSGGTSPVLSTPTQLPTATSTVATSSGN